MFSDVLKYMLDADPASFDAEDAKIGMYCKSKEGKFLWANKGFLGYFHLTLPQITGQREDELNLALDSDALRKIEDDVLINGLYIKKIIDVAASGTKRKILVTEFPVFDKGRNIIGLMGYFMDITPYKRLQEAWKEDALTDDLTGLKNRKAWSDVASEHLEHPTVVAFFDIDHFKQMNDKHGHDHGDELLKKYAGALERIYGYENCYRYGGDEFLVIAEFISEDDMDQKFNEMKEALVNLDILGEKFSINTSCGYVYKSPKSIPEIEDMIKKADKQLYQAKEAGRNQIIGMKMEDENESAD